MANGFDMKKKNQLILEMTSRFNIQFINIKRNLEGNTSLGLTVKLDLSENHLTLLLGC